MTHADSLEVHVEIEGETIFAGNAQFHRSRGRLTATTFQCDPTYLEHPRAYRLDPALELVSGAQHVEGLPGAFSDSAPDRWGRNLIAKRERATALGENRRADSLDDVDFLAGVADLTRQGALRFRVDPNGAFIDVETAVPRLLMLPELLRAAEAAANDGEDGLEAVKLLLAAGTGSLGGARPKASVRGENDRLMIAKFPHREDDWDVMAWEATALELAEAAGVRVATHRLIRIDGRHLLLLDRFDRSDEGHRIGYMSAMTLLEHRDGESADYVEIAEMLTEISAEALTDRRQLFLRAAVNVGLNNTDDHLRNHGFLRKSRGWVLSPAFDINPNPNSSQRQTAIGGADSGEFAAEGLVQLATTCRLSPAEARKCLHQAGAALGRWREVAAGNGIPEAQLSRFAGTFAEGIAALKRATALFPEGGAPVRGRRFGPR
ncbi:type II toxin-antitoxin system HipA family toxin [Mycetocola saprophilus]|uniref:type II toxin-antitoxin system HipA family toxin n=1 Tax=Mycetocola saprophilus TaxID=76636 RepID=UPI00068D600F|nr:type II toxin-antitoxin system HipA family toxin [Mycetocola saprophilus]